MFIVVAVLAALACARGAGVGPDVAHAVIVSTSRYWFNYRHTANALAIYQTLRRQGVPDDQIVLMLADDHGSSGHNPFGGAVFASDEDTTDNL